MEKDVKLGSLGDLDLSFSGGKAKLELKASALDGAASVGAVIELDSKGFCELLKKALEKAIPASTAIDEAVFPSLESMIASIQ